nr:type IA DNA topoisomerase [uncultured Clostridium sp.]
MILVIAEKPSVSASISKVIGAKSRKNGYFEGNGYLVSWCLGHLAEYVEPNEIDEKYVRWNYEDLPIIPEKWQLSVAEAKNEQFAILSSLLGRSDVEYVVNACDAGREGESIFRRVYGLTDCTIPMKRLWISSMEDAAIRVGFEALKDGKDYDSLYEAAECRAKADWLVGMNATRAYTTKYYKRLVVGRVQTPTLAMLVERQKKIDGFVKEAYYRVSLTGEGLTVTSENISDKAEADALADTCQGKTMKVTKLEKTRKSTKPPKLYDLTTLQREANRFFGYTAQETLDTLQELYEGKLVTYPRTDSQYITEDMKETVEELLLDIQKFTDFLPGMEMGNNVDRLINAAKVTDHHAILPTKEAVKADIFHLPEKQKKVFMLISCRLAQAVADDLVYEETKAEALCEGSTFKAKGKTEISPGFQAVADAFRAHYVKSRDEEERNVIPSTICEGMEIVNVEAKRSEHFTTPPKPYSEDTLLSAMETAGNKEFDPDTEKKGLGTPATRAGIIEKLVHSGYAVRKGKQILPTKDGCELISVLPDYIKSASLTADWEGKLLAVERGGLSAENFINDILGLVFTVLAGCNAIPEEERQRFDNRESVGACPICGKPVYESKKNFYCSDKSCSFALWKESRYLASMKKSIDKKMAKELLEKGKTYVPDFYSAKKDSSFGADLVMKLEDGRPAFSLEFPPRKDKGKGGKSTGKKAGKGKKK